MDKDDKSRLLILTQGDISLLPVKEGALVNPSNTGLILTGGGVSSSLAKRGGPFLQQTLHMARSRLKNNRLEPGQALDTEAGQLQAKRLIHVAIIGAKKVNRRLVSQAILNAFDLADQIGMRQIAFPTVGTGAAGYPLDGFMELFWKITSEELPRARNLREVYLCLAEGEEFEEAQAWAQAHLGELAAPIQFKVASSGLVPGMFR